MITAHTAIMDISKVQKPDALKTCPAYRVLCEKLDKLAEHNQAHPEELEETRTKMFPLAVEAITTYDAI